MTYLQNSSCDRDPESTLCNAPLKSMVATTIAAGFLVMRMLMPIINNDLQSSKRVLQCVCAIAGAILGGGLILVFPPAGATIALGGTGSMAAGAAIAGGATGGCLVAPIVHEKTHKALVQQVQNFKAKEEVSKKAE